MSRVADVTLWTTNSTVEVLPRVVQRAASGPSPTRSHPRPPSTALAAWVGLAVVAAASSGISRGRRGDRVARVSGQCLASGTIAIGLRRFS